MYKTRYLLLKESLPRSCRVSIRKTECRVMVSLKVCTRGRVQGATGGVWVSQELWRSIRRQLETKLQEINTMTVEHAKV